MNAINYTNLREKMLKKYGNPEQFTSSIKTTNYCKFEVKVNGKHICEIVMSIAERNHFTRSKYYMKGVTLGGLGYVNPIVKPYHEQLQPIVTPYLKHFHRDFTYHDKKELAGYTGEFYYGMRDTGTNIFCVEKLEKALKSLLACRTTSFFTSRGLRWIYNGEIKAEDVTLEVVSLLSSVLGNDRFFIGNNGKITEVPKDKFIQSFKKRLIPVQQMMDELRGSIFVWNLMLSVEKLETKAREEREENDRKEWIIKSL
jgi:hypothetical protein